MSTIICNAPFCQNSRNPNHAWCGEHRWEREKYKVKVYKELLPFWCSKRCDIHGLLRFEQAYLHPTNKNYICRQCAKDKTPIYNPIRAKIYNDKRKDYRRESRFNKRYNMGIQEYEELLKNQNNKCALCKISIEDHQKRKGSNHWFAVDHCHTTGKIRGLLCFKCNMGLGYFNDNTTLLRTALKYLREHE